MNRRALIVYATLIAAWGLILAWQVAEHMRVRKSARAALINRAKDISNTLGIVMRSQRRFFGVISKERLEATLNDLVRPGELNAIALLNATGETVASAGDTSSIATNNLAQQGERWSRNTVTLMNLVDLGSTLTEEPGEERPTIIIPTGDRDRDGDRPERPDRRFRPPPPPEEFEPGTTNELGESSGQERPREWRGPRGGGPPRPFGRPFWMSEEEYQSLIQKQGVHSFLLVMSTNPVRAAIRADLWMRLIITLLATLSVSGFGLAWRNLTRSSELEVRLVRASELNSHLKEMNLAAAGLAHETRNPLNIIRGLAQLISRESTTSPEIHEKSHEIIEETDRVTAQLNEFINYSRPREVRPARVELGQVLNELKRTLAYDLDEKAVELRLPEDLPAIRADEQLLRQALFNLLINAVQAVDGSGQIEIGWQKNNSHGMILEVKDNGPGVADEHRQEIFRPYFTTHQKGTGLGLAIVQQIVLAHGWEITISAHEPRGALFRISHIKLA